MENQIAKKFPNNTFEEYNKSTKVELLEVAKSLKIPGRHEMNKKDLILNIIDTRKACEEFKSRLNSSAASAADEDSTSSDDMSNSNNKKENVKTMSIVNENTTTSSAVSEKNSIPPTNSDESEKYATQIPSVPKKPQSEYINNIEVGMIIAFKISENKAISAKVEKISRGPDSEGISMAYCRTKNGIEYKVPRKAIIWVKTGTRWPRGIFLQLKNGSDENRKEEAENSINSEE